MADALDLSLKAQAPFSGIPLFPILRVFAAIIAGLGFALGDPFFKFALLGCTVPLLIHLASRRPRVLIGATLVLLLAPAPPSVPLAGTLFGIPFLLTDFLMPFCLLGACLHRTNQTSFKPLQIFAVAIVIGAVVGLTRGFSAEDIVRDLRYPFYLLSFIIGARFCSPADRRTGARLLIGILWYSAFALLLSAFFSVSLVSGRVEPVFGFATQQQAGSPTRFLISTTHIALAVLCSCLSAVLLARPLTHRVLVAVGLLAAPSSILVFFSFSRRTFLALGFSLVFTMLVSAHRRRLLSSIRLGALAGAVAALIAGIGFLAPTFIAKSGYVAQSFKAYSERVLSGVKPLVIQDDPGIRFREFENRHAISAFKRSPFIGHGFGARYRPPLAAEPFFDPEGRVDRKTGPTYVHDAYLWYLVKIGLVGLASLLILITGPLILSVRALRQNFDPVVAAIGAGVAGILAVNLVSPLLNTPPVAAAVGVLTGYLVGFARAGSGDSSKPQSTPNSEESTFSRAPVTSAL